MSNPNNLEVNKGDQFIVALDVSGSMQNTDCPGGLSRYNYCKETLNTFVKEAEKFDPDGVSFYLFGATVSEYRDTKSGEIEAKLGSAKFQSATQTHLAIRAAYKEHKDKANQQTFLLIFTDGEPTEADQVKKAIIEITNDVKDEKEFRIAFLTVGTRTPELEKFLVDLDDNLKNEGAKYDIVDVKEADKVDFMAAIDGALND